MDAPVTFVIYAVIGAGILTASGIYVLRGLVLAVEGHREFHGDTLTKRSRLKGFGLAVLWTAAAVIHWSFVFDWYLTGSTEIAFDRLMIKLRILLEIMAAFGDD